jgi:hypothetical protein
MEVFYQVATVHRVNGKFTKGIAIHETRDAAEQAFHNEFTAWAYGKVEGCDYVCAYIHDSNGALVRAPEIWKAAEEPAPEA